MINRKPQPDRTRPDITITENDLAGIPDTSPPEIEVAIIEHTIDTAVSLVQLPGGIILDTSPQTQNESPKPLIQQLAQALKDKILGVMRLEVHPPKKETEPEIVILETYEAEVPSQVQVTQVAKAIDEGESEIVFRDEKLTHAGTIDAVLSQAQGGFYRPEIRGYTPSNLERRWEVSLESLGDLSLVGQDDTRFERVIIPYNEIISMQQIFARYPNREVAIKPFSLPCRDPKTGELFTVITFSIELETDAAGAGGVHIPIRASTDAANVADRIERLAATELVPDEKEALAAKNPQGRAAFAHENVSWAHNHPNWYPPVPSGVDFPEMIKHYNLPESLTIIAGSGQWENVINIYRWVPAIKMAVPQIGFYIAGYGYIEELTDHLPAAERGTIRPDQLKVYPVAVRYDPKFVRVEAT